MSGHAFHLDPKEAEKVSHVLAYVGDDQKRTQEFHKWLIAEHGGKYEDHEHDDKTIKEFRYTLMEMATSMQAFAMAMRDEKVDPVEWIDTYDAQSEMLAKMKAAKDN